MNDDTALLERFEAGVVQTPAPTGHFLADGSGEYWSEKFRDIEKYDWEDPAWKRQNKGCFSFLPIPLTQGYFMIVSRRDFRRMTTFPDGSRKRWYANVQRDDRGNILKVYAVRRGRDNEPRAVLAHRELLRCLHEKGEVDHVNSWSLDNRGNPGQIVNLILGPRSLNVINSVVFRRVNPGLLSGVEHRGFSKEGKQRYGGIRSVRIRPSGKGSVKTFRSKKRWLTQGPAHRWYLNQLKKLSAGRTTWAHSLETVARQFPVFPPLIDREPEIIVSRRQAKIERELDNIPF